MDKVIITSYSIHGISDALWHKLISRYPIPDVFAEGWLGCKYPLLSYNLIPSEQKPRLLRRFHHPKDKCA